MSHKPGDNRRAERLRCHFAGFLYSGDEVVEVRFVDISRTGICISLKDWIGAKPGSAVRLRTSELGFIEGTIRWYRAGKMGIKLTETTNTTAQINSYFKHYHKQIAANSPSAPPQRVLMANGRR
ncbi:PilZ domain-containing protein [Affinirhizobium pseudoryzae]|uniref:PilZ domain-containing protein n=1 Tax=Allorhizobium pseudoryzae TaxID=379684 RepID=UPI0013E9BB0F|nr:PilZ domain-containing protein [Allorhizobium pseudoryzae]